MWIIDPEIPLGLWWALTATAVVVSAWYATRRNWSITLGRRCLFTALIVFAFAGPLIVVLNPTWVESIPPIPGNPVLTVLTDGTLSMATEDVGPAAAQSRWDRAGVLGQQVDGRQHSVDVRHKVFGEQLESGAELQDSEFQITSTASKPSESAAAGSAQWPQGHRTDLARVIQQAVRSGAPQGHAIVLLSDGAHNASSVQRVLHAAREADALATPIYTCTIGSKVGLKNLSLTARAARLIAFPDTPLSIGVNVSHRGLAGQTTSVVLRRDGKSLDQQEIRLDQRGQQSVRFTLPEIPKDAIQRYQVTASEVAQEATAADNQTTVLVQRLGKPVGVLFLEGKPYWDSKFLTRNLGSDAIVEMTSMVRLSEGRYLKRKFIPPKLNTLEVRESAGTAELRTESWQIQPHPTSPLDSLDFLEQYRVVILGRDTDTYLTETAVDNLRTWISHSGGCLVCSRGAPADRLSSKLASILPVKWSRGNEARFRAEVSSHGVDVAVFDPLLTGGGDLLGAMPSLATSAVPNKRAGLPQVLLQSSAADGGESIPVVTYQPYGSGLSIVVEGAGMWRWAFLAPEHADKDSLYPTLWQSLVQWVVSQQDGLPGQMVSIRSERAHFLSGDSASAAVTVRDADYLELARTRSLSVLLQAAGQAVPSRHSLVPTGQQVGSYRVDLGKLDVGYYSANVVGGSSDNTIATTTFEVRDPWFETLEIDARPDVMRKIANQSGGAVLSEQELKELAGKFAERIRRQQVHEEVRTTMWDKPLVLLVILAGWIGTWVVRRKSGLV